MNMDVTSVGIRPIGPVKSVGKLFYEFMGEVEGVGQKPIVVFMPMDRRQARRVARKTGRKFRVVQGEMVWR